MVACAPGLSRRTPSMRKKEPRYGRCVFCGTCERVSEGRFHLLYPGFRNRGGRKGAPDHRRLLPDLAAHSKQHFKKLFGRSLQLRQVSAAGCNACEADLNVLATPFFDLARFGINFVASPRHSDGIVVTGPISRNMKTALLQTYEAVPDPKVVIAVGSCTLTGGRSAAAPKSPKGLDKLLPVDLFIPGCPPHPNIDQPARPQDVTILQVTLLPASLDLMMKQFSWALAPLPM
jgi:Ni,Fe-hydrogenase III small subunit